MFSLSETEPLVEPAISPDKFSVDYDGDLTFDQKGFDLSLTEEMVAGRIGQNQFYSFWRDELRESDEIL